MKANSRYLPFINFQKKDSDQYGTSSSLYPVMLTSRLPKANLPIESCMQYVQFCLQVSSHVFVPVQMEFCVL